MHSVVATPAKRDQMRHRVYAWATVMSHQQLPINFAAHPAAETITPQDVIEQAVKIIA